MRIGIIVASGGVLLWASCAQAQELKCPDIPPTSARSSDTSVGAKVSLIEKIISAFDLTVDRKTTIDDVLSRYPDAGDLYLALQRVGTICPTIIHDPNLTWEQKREELKELFAEVVVPGPAIPGPGEPAPMLSQAGAAATAQELMSLMIVGANFMERLSAPSCIDGNIFPTAEALRSWTEEGGGQVPLSNYGRVTASVTAVRTVVDYVANPSEMSRPGGFDLYNAVKQCQAGNVFFPRDYVVGILLEFLDQQRELRGEILVDPQSGLVKGVLMM